ncbi:MAG: transcriptional repressor LexA [Planctomycetota bacterium]
MAAKQVLKMSRKQKEILESLRRFARERGYVPSIRELADQVKRSASTVYQHLMALKKKGYLRSDGTAHSWEVFPEDGGSSERGKGPDKGWGPIPEAPRVAVAVRGTIAAGSPIEAIEDPRETLHLPLSLAREGCYALRVQGRSMEDDHILDGDIVIIHPQPSVENGAVAVVLLEDGSATLKRVYREKTRVRLQPANSEMAPIYVRRLVIQGKVVGLVRKH